MAGAQGPCAGWTTPQGRGGGPLDPPQPPAWLWPGSRGPGKASLIRAPGLSFFPPTPLPHCIRVSLFVFGLFLEGQ